MMKKTTLLFTAFMLLLGATSLKAQDKFLMKKTMVVFDSKTSLEDIKANNTSTQGVIISGKNKFLVRVPIQAFSFKRRLQQTHFNENYMESHKYPNAIFRGLIEGDYSLTKDGVYKVQAKGSLTIHGVKRDRTIPATITVKSGQASFSANFTVKPADHKIKIPKLVTSKIAEKIKVAITADLEKK